MHFIALSSALKDVWFPTWPLQLSVLIWVWWISLNEALLNTLHSKTETRIELKQSQLWYTIWQFSCSAQDKDAHTSNELCFQAKENINPEGRLFRCDYVSIKSCTPRQGSKTLELNGLSRGFSPEKRSLNPEKKPKYLSLQMPEYLRALNKMP